MPRYEIGIVMPLMQEGPDRRTYRWPEMRAFALRAEELGFDTIWTPDELLWRTEDGPDRGFWDGISIAGAVAAVTTRAKVGSWVMSALHRNPGIVAKTVETLDEISGGRFVFGLGAGHEWPGQANAYGLPEAQIFARFEESLRIIVPLLRAGHANFEGSFHAARDLPQRPHGPRPGRIPLLIGGNGPKGQRHAVRHADIWSAYVEERAHVDELAPRIASLEGICAEEGRDPASIGRSIGVVVNPTLPAEASPGTLSGSTDEIFAGLRSFLDAGYTQVEIMIRPGTVAALETVLPIVEAVHTA